MNILYLSRRTVESLAISMGQVIQAVETAFMEKGNGRVEMPPKEACRDADIVVTAGPILKYPQPVLEKAWLRESAFIAPVDFDSYLKPEVFAAAAKLFTDDLAQQEYYKKIGYFQSVRPPDGDLGELVTRKKIGRANQRELTICVNLGLALEDMATAIIIYRAARDKGRGQLLPV